MEHKTTLIVRGGGDLASGVIHGFIDVVIRYWYWNVRRPSAIRREGFFWRGSFRRNFLCGGSDRPVDHEDVSECQKVWEHGELPILVDESGKVVKELETGCADRCDPCEEKSWNNEGDGTADRCVGPGFEAGKDVDFVIETQRGHDLGRMIAEGPATPNTGSSGMIAGYGKERVIHSPAAGIMHNRSRIGDIVEKDQIIAMVDATPVYASLTGVLSGIIRDGYKVPKGMKLADIDPRKEQKKNCDTVSDKARCIAGSVVEVLMANGVLP